MKAFAERIKQSFKNIKENIISCLIVIDLCLIAGYGIGMWIGLLAKFIREKGYSNQIALIKSSGAAGVVKSFTVGDAAGFYGIYAIATILMLFVCFLLVFVSFYKDESKLKKILLTLSIIFVFGLAIAWIVINKILDKKGEASKLFVMVRPKEGIGVLTIIFALLLAVAVICFVVLIFKSKGRTGFLYGICFGVAYFAVLPALLILAENLIPLIVVVVLAALTVGIVALVTLMAKKTRGMNATKSEEPKATKVGEEPIEEVTNVTDADEEPINGSENADEDANVDSDVGNED